MKNLFLASTITLFISVGAFAKDEKTAQRKPNQQDQFISQVQLCDGTEALGNEGQGMGASAFVNVYAEMNSTVKPAPLKCDLAFAFAYEYGNDRGIKIGNISPYNMTTVPTGKTECTVKEENGQVSVVVTKATSLKSKRAPKILVDTCKVSVNGF